MDRVLEFSLGLLFALSYNFNRLETSWLMFALTTFIACGLSLGIVSALKLLASYLLERMEGNSAQEDLDRSFRKPILVVLLSQAATLPIGALRYLGGDIKTQSLKGQTEGTYILWNEVTVFSASFDLLMLLRVVQIALVAISIAIFVFALIDHQRLTLKNAVGVAAIIYGAAIAAFFLALPVMFAFFNPT